MSTVKKALVHSILGGYATSVISLAIVVVTARLLTPAEVGLFAIAASILIIAENLKTFGIGPYIVRIKDLTELEIKRALGLSIIISWGLGILVVLLAYPMSVFYEQPDMLFLLLILSASFFFSPYISISSALLQRDFKFNLLVVADLLSGVTQLGFLVALVYLDFSYFSIAISIFFANLAMLSAHMFINKKHIMVRPSFSNLKEIGEFGVYITFINLLTRLNFILPDLIIGKLGTTSMVALISRAIGILDFAIVSIVKGIAGISLPYLSKVKRENGDMHVSYTRASELTSSILLPFMALIYVLNDQVVLLFFGETWLQSAPLVKIFAVWGAIMSFHSLSNSVFISSGKEKVAFYIALLLTVFLALAIYFAFPFGLDMVARMFVVAAVIRVIVVSGLVHFMFKINAFKFMVAHIKCIACGFVCLFTAHYLETVFSNQISSNFVFLCVVCSISLVVWLLFAFLIKMPIVEEIKPYLIRAKLS